VLERFHAACKSGDLPVIRAAYSAAQEVGLDANSTTREGYNALHCACFRETGHEHVVSFLIKQGDVDIHALTSLKHSAFDLACAHGYMKIFKLLVEHQLRLNREKMRKEFSFSSSRDQGSSSISVSVDCSPSGQHGGLHPENIMGSPLARNKRGSALNSNSKSLMASPDRGVTPASSRADEEKEVNALWLEQKVEQIAAAIQSFIRQDSQGFTPLHYACFKGHFDVAHVLCSQGQLTKEHVNCRQKQGRTCVALAAQRNLVDIVRYLIVQHGGDLSIADATGATPLLLATYYESVGVLQLFASELLPRFEAGHADLVNKTGKAALHYACQKGNVSAACILVDCFKAKLDLQTRGGKTPLSFACAGGHVDMVRNEEDWEMNYK
jgi:ankyrin repeat protein